MSKHKKKNLQQLIQKRQQLQNVIAQTGEATIVLTNKPTPVNSSNPQPVSKATVGSTETHHNIEIRHTVISLAVIIILLLISVYIDHKTTYFTTFGGWLYTFLRLKS